MKRLILYLQEFRYPQWSKNIVLFMPIFFGGKLIDLDSLLAATLGFVTFSFTASLVYVFNDLRDIDEDRNHPQKKNRPIASGKISHKEALGLLFFLVVIVSLLTLYINILPFTVVLFLYLLINLFYSISLKRVPFLELILVTCCYVLRLLAGGAITGIVVSDWLLIVIFFGALLFISGKRLTEKRNSKTRSVLTKYSVTNLKLMVLLAASASVACLLIYSIIQGPVYIPQAIIYGLAVTRYILLLENTDKGESSGIFLDKQLLTLIFLFSAYTFFIIYYRGHLL